MRNNLGSIYHNEEECEFVSALLRMAGFNALVNPKVVKAWLDNEELVYGLKREQIIFMDNCIRANRSGINDAREIFTPMWMYSTYQRVYYRIEDTDVCPLDDAYKLYSNIVSRVNHDLDRRPIKWEDKQWHRPKPNWLEMSDDEWYGNVEKRKIPDKIEFIPEVFEVLKLLNLKPDKLMTLWAKVLLNHTDKHVMRVPVFTIIMCRLANLYLNSEIDLRYNESSMFDSYYDKLRAGDIDGYMEYFTSKLV